MAVFICMAQIISMAEILAYGSVFNMAQFFWHMAQIILWQCFIVAALIIIVVFYYYVN